MKFQNSIAACLRMGKSLQGVLEGDGVLLVCEASNHIACGTGSGSIHEVSK